MGQRFEEGTQRRRAGSLSSFERLLLLRQPVGAHRPKRLTRVTQDLQHILHRSDEPSLDGRWRA